MFIWRSRREEVTRPFGWATLLSFSFCFARGVGAAPLPYLKLRSPDMS